MVQKENLKPCQLKKYIINIIIPVQSLYLHVCVQFQQGIIPWMCSCSGPLECKDIKLFLGKGARKRQCLHVYTHTHTKKKWERNRKLLI